MTRALATAVAVLALWPAAARAQLPKDREELLGGIAGRACRDVNNDGRCAADEPGYPNLRLVLESGQQVWTDAQGRYHFAAVASRVEDASFGGRLLPGRHRVRADLRGLLPGSRVVPRGATVEVPMAGLVLQDFAVQQPNAQAVANAPARVQAAHPGALVREGAEFTLMGQVAPFAQVSVDGSPAQVDAQGVYRARVHLKPGPNDVPIRVASPDGTVQLFVQGVDLVPRKGGALVIPRELAPVASLALPGTAEEPAAVGPGRIRVQAPSGTRVAWASGEAVVDASGALEVPVELQSGENVVLLRLARPGQKEQQERVVVQARPRPFVVGLLDVEAGWRLDQTNPALALGVFGRGAAHAEVPWGRWLLEGELDLRDTDLLAVREGGAAVLSAPRNPLNLERALDPERTPAVWADQSSSIDPNAPEGRVRLEARHPELGRLGFGTYRAQFSDAEVGRYHRELYGAYADLHTSPGGSAGAKVEGFASPGAVDPASGLSTVAAHAEFLPTGGSLFYLPHSFIARGSEQVRVVLRDGLTGVPVAEQHLVRGVDYELDAASGRILLAAPLSLAVAPPFFGADAPTAGTEPVLQVDYEYVDATAAPRASVGGRAGARFGPAELSVGAVREESGGGLAYQLLRGTASTRLGGLLLSAEAAYSRGRAHEPSAVALSDSGGFDFERPAASDARAGWAFSVRLRGPTFNGGRVDASWRRREGGYSDAVWDGRGRLAELSALVEQPLGPIVLGALVDGTRTADPRDPYGGSEVSSRLAGGYVAFRRPSFEARVEAKDQELTLDADAPPESQTAGGRTSVGALLRYRVMQPLWLQVAHKQVLSRRGDGPGAYDDSFSSVGADVALNDQSQVGVRAGWGPHLGALAWVQGQVRSGPDVYYGSYSVDVDGPDFGERKAVSGARTAVSDGTAVFVEDVAAHDATSVRLARAVGLSYALSPGWDVSARYERGVRDPLGGAPSLRRDAGGLSLSLVRERVRAYGRVEARYERGDTFAASGVQRLQRLASAAVSWDVLQNVSLGGRLNFSDAYNRGVREARLLEASANLAWRLEPLMVVLHYGVERELSPVRPSAGERTLERVSLMPSLKLGDRFAVAAGLHVGRSTIGGNSAFVLSASVRPSVRVVGGLELAAELARRSVALDEGELTALRGEVGYRFDDELLVAGGYSVFGYQGLGLTPDEKNVPRVYLRAEAAW